MSRKPWRILRGSSIGRPRSLPRNHHHAWLAVLLLAGCSANSKTSPTDPATVASDDILKKCGAAYQNLNTLQARGVLVDCRAGAPVNVPISLDFSRPDKCRLQFGTQVAIISGRDWWTCDDSAGQYRKHNQFTRTPIETAAYLLTKSVPFLTPSLLTRGSAAFSTGRANRNERWQLQGVGWHAEAPCYVMTRREENREEILRIWVDQDRFLLRGWMISVPTRDGRERPILECTYSELTVDGRLPSDWLQLKPPAPLPSATSRIQSRQGERERRSSAAEAKPTARP